MQREMVDLNPGPSCRHQQERFPSPDWTYTPLAVGLLVIASIFLLRYAPEIVLQQLLQQAMQF